MKQKTPQGLFQAWFIIVPGLLKNLKLLCFKAFLWQNQ